MSILEIYNLFPGSWLSNCYVLIADGNDGKRHAAVVDPSTSAVRILEQALQNSAKLEYIVMTHGHFDHIMALDTLRNISGAPAFIHEDDAEMLTDGDKNAHNVFFGQDKTFRPAEHTLHHGDKLMLGCEELEVISTPGHTKGSICLYNRKDKFMLTGDTIFADSYGRFDLYGGDRSALVSTLTSLHRFDRGITIYPGHGDSETLGNALDNIYNR